MNVEKYFKVTIKGQEFEFTESEMLELRDSINNVIGTPLDFVNPSHPHNPYPWFEAPIQPYIFPTEPPKHIR